MKKTELIQKAKVAQEAKHYDDMTTCMKAVTEQGAKLSREQCNMLFKNVVRGGRAIPKVIWSMKQKTTTSDKQL
ncbi:14-3-3 protein theta [Lynx pardinus]|uniref:14-3-3 protein theta n=1 Tax=Lynx pardinus TaxID=191816 RepID=A0A485MWD3_LYNPA|nr:14-3-3 protein theta [Lynx pardinus]